VRILVSNDDGVDAPGIRALADAVSVLGTVWRIAPVSEQSAKSHSLTLHKPLRAQRRGERVFAVSGTPADCIYLATYELMDHPPDLVISGVNRGANLGNDVHYSGTVAAAREACLAGAPAIAVSLHTAPDDDTAHWATACDVALHVARAVVDGGLPPATLLNVNVPNVPLPELRGIRAATLGTRRYENRVTRRTDPWGRDYYWIGGTHLGFAGLPGSDGVLIEEGYATVTPLFSDPTLADFLPTLRARVDR
jgi:5'-nucleotidase